MKRYDVEDTIVAIATPVGEGGIGIVRLSGPLSIKIADDIFAPKSEGRVSEFKTYTTHYGHVIDKNKNVIDEVILTVMRAPASYTKEDVVEINCHGGIQALRKVLALVVKSGAKVAEPGEFTKRAFLNGRIDLAQAEAVLDVIRAKTEGSLKVAMNQLDGELSKSVNAIREDLLDIASRIEASIDFPEEDVGPDDKIDLSGKAEAIIKKLKGLVDSYEEGVILREGLLAIICGKPNVGKSSLMNLLLKRDRVIVSPVPGTTRDAVEETINLKGVPIRLVDTAGISVAKDILEKESVKRSKKYLKMADIALLVLDASTAMDRKDKEIGRLIGDMKKIVIINKSDLRRKIDIAEVRSLFKGDKIVEISVEKKSNIGKLEEIIIDTVYSGSFTQGESAIITSARHKASLDKAHRSMLSVKKAITRELSPELLAIDIKDAIYELGLIVGKSVSEDILDRIFERFCIGK